MKIPLCDLKAQYLSIRGEIDDAIQGVISKTNFIQGEEVRLFEREFAAFCGARFGVAVASGTDALHLALLALGVGPGDEVITSPHTFTASAEAVCHCGARPVFVDIDPRTYNIDPALVEARITPRSRAIMPVHLFGQCADMDPILDIARRHRLVVIEDAAQAIGAEYRGRRAGSLGHYGALSFFPSKNLGAAGDAGMVVTNDAHRAERLRVLRAHGSKPKYYHQLIGGNFRLDPIQAAIITVKLRHLDAWTAARQANAARYRRLFAALLPSPAERGGGREGRPAGGDAQWSGGDGLVQLPHEHADRRHIYNQFIIRTPRRDELQAHLKQHGVGTEVYYPVPMHLQQCFASLGYGEGDMPESESAARQTLALPIYPELTAGQQQHVADTAARLLGPANEESGVTLGRQAE